MADFIEFVPKEDPQVAAMLRSREDIFPGYTITGFRDAFASDFRLVEEGVAAAKPLPPELPIDIRGTAFQWRVWRALTRIPRGQTRSYSDIARAIGSPTSVRVNLGSDHDVALPCPV